MAVLFYICNVIFCRGEVRAVDGIGKSISVGQVVWAPSFEQLDQYLVFVGWPSENRKLGIRYCYNRPCAIYAVKAPFSKSEPSHSGYVQCMSEELMEFYHSHIF